MRYALLAHAEPATWDELTDEERAAWATDDAAFDAELERRGCLVHAGTLDDPFTATTVRVAGGEVVLTDGPFAETAEHLGAYVVVDVADLDEALALAKRSPAARLGSLEVRPVRVGTT